MSYLDRDDDDYESVRCFKCREPLGVCECGVITKPTFTNAEDIRRAVRNGKTVHLGNPGYTVILDSIGQYLITYAHNDYCIGLTWHDGVTLNGPLEDFYIPTP